VKGIIEKILLDFPEIRLLSRKDNPKIIKFFDEVDMQSEGLVLRYERAPDFFTFLDYQSDEYFVFGSDKDEANLRGIGSMVVREAYVDGEMVKVAYLGDLRVKAGISFSHKWQNFYSRLIAAQKELGIAYFLTAVMAQNEKAKKALVNNPKAHYHYQKISDYQMVNLIMPFGIKSKTKDLLVRRARRDDLEKLLIFLDQEERKKTFGYPRDFIERALRIWPDFQIEKFVLVILNNEIVAACGTWNPSPTKKIVVDHLPRSLKIFNYMLRPFTKVMQEKSELKVQYLNFLNLKNNDENIFNALLNYLYGEGLCQKFDVLAFADFAPFPLKKQLKGVLFQSTALELYTVSPLDHRPSFGPKTSYSLLLSMI
jgi:hypothetical protein